MIVQSLKFVSGLDLHVKDSVVSSLHCLLVEEGTWCEPRSIRLRFLEVEVVDAMVRLMRNVVNKVICHEVRWAMSTATLWKVKM